MNHRKRIKSRPSTAPVKEGIQLLPSERYTSSLMHTVHEDENSPISQSVPLNLPPEAPNDFDWPTFMAAYATGRWDPNGRLKPPMSSSKRLSKNTLQDSSEEHTPTSSPIQPSPTTGAPHFVTHRIRNSFSASSAVPKGQSASANQKYNMFIPLPQVNNTSFTSGLPSPYAIVSAAASTSYTTAHPQSLPPSFPLSTASRIPSSPGQPHAIQATVAAMRLAANNVNLAPLALPSPEHELSDPMRGVNTTVPGTHDEHYSLDLDSETSSQHVQIHRRHSRHPPSDHDIVTTPGGTKKRLSTRLEGLKEFWDGTREVETPSMPDESNDYFSLQSSAAPVPSLFDHEVPLTTSNTDPGWDTSGVARINFARKISEPLPVAVSQGRNRIHSIGSGHGLGISILGASPTVPISIPSPNITDQSSSASISTVSSSDSSTLNFPTVPSANGVIPSGSWTGIQTIPYQKDELSYHQSGYLAPPLPPDELERRRALYRFNIWRTASDSNFDRIARLAMVVYATHGAFISLLDGSDQWFKSSCGLEVSSVARNHSFCGHTILLQDGEPMVVLDTHLDWRFVNNPLVTGKPQIRFYAGAPLRTQDGHNIGSLAVIDDRPRYEFTPRQRHALKEFASIVMREMELWRDKIQLNIRDKIQRSMEEFSRECLEIDMGENQRRNKYGPSSSSTSSLSSAASSRPLSPVANADLPRHSREEPDRPAHQSRSISTANIPLSSTTMDKVYSRAARLIQRTLDVEGVIVMDVSLEILEPTISVGAPLSEKSNGGDSTPLGVPPSSLSASSAFLTTPTASKPSSSFTSSTGCASVGMYYGDAEMPMQSKSLNPEEFRLLTEFFEKEPHGKRFEGVVPLAFRTFLPSKVKYALAVPVFNIDQRPFALLCAYNASDHTKGFWEDHELSYLRAIGVIILSAVLKRRMLLADKAKSLFISNISHELRTPLSGILNSAELLGDTTLNDEQGSLLRSIHGCATSLVETVNHVLDFTKLSGNTKAGGVENTIPSSEVDFIQLVEEAVDGCWVGYQARTTGADSNGIGSVYAPPDVIHDPNTQKNHVEPVIDVAHRDDGWLLRCEKGGLRRVLMNIFGNSLKFTTDGFVHVIVRAGSEANYSKGDTIKVELLVHDTGKGISQSFLRNQLFHPFSQENPQQSGTGLGLAIVNNIVQSDSIGGKVDVWSEEGTGTEIKVTFQAEVLRRSGDDISLPLSPSRVDDVDRPVSITLLGFDSPHKGIKLLRSVIERYLVTWWNFSVTLAAGDIVILNEDLDPVIQATHERDSKRPFIVLTSIRGNSTTMDVVTEYELIGGFCRVIYKPVGPSRLHELLKLCLQYLKIGRYSDVEDTAAQDNDLPHSQLTLARTRRKSEGTIHQIYRPMLRRPSTAYPFVPDWKSRTSESNVNSVKHDDTDAGDDTDGDTSDDTISVSGGTLLKSSVEFDAVPTPTPRRSKILVVEDNIVLRVLLMKWLQKEGFRYSDAVNGQHGVDVFQKEGPFDAILLDLSMPILDGFGATARIRELEEAHHIKDRSKILILTGMSTIEDKRRAFEAGADGYLVKPVELKALRTIFQRLGLS